MKFITNIVFKFAYIFLLWIPFTHCFRDSLEKKRLQNYAFLEVLGDSLDDSVSLLPSQNSVVNHLEVVRIRFPDPLMEVVPAELVVVDGPGLGSLTLTSVLNQSSRDIVLEFKGSPADGEIFIRFSDLKFTGRFGNFTNSYVFRYVIDNGTPTVSYDFNSGDFPSFLDDGYLDVQFSEQVNNADKKESYTFSEPIASDVIILNVLSLGNNRYRLVFAGKSYRNFDHFSLTLTSIEDVAQNPIQNPVIQFYQPSVKSVGNLLEPRCWPELVKLPDNKVMVIGGYKSTTQPLSTIEIFDTVTNTSTAYPFPMTTQRAEHTATLLRDGRILVVAGIKGSSSSLVNFLANYEILDADGIIPPVSGNLPAQVRRGHKAILGLNGKVYVLGGRGGVNANDPLSYLDRVDEFDPSTNTFSAAGTLASRRDGLSVSLDPSGKILASGGILIRATHIKNFEFYDPNTQSGTISPNLLTTTRRDHSTIRTKNGDYYILGGGNLAQISIVEKIGIDGNVSYVGNLTEQRYKGGFASWNDSTILAIGGKKAESLAYSIEAINLTSQRIYNVGSLPFRGECTTILPLSKTDILIFASDYDTTYTGIQRLKIDE